MEKLTYKKLLFPWLSIILMTIAILFLFIAANPSLKIALLAALPFSFYLPTFLFNAYYQAIGLMAILLIVFWDIGRFYSQRKQYDNTIKSLSLAKKNLQNKAHTYASHSDKLKLFISDRLLEYIQYDEKFMHFKNIAAEVRHNGVICFDKVQHALTLAETKNAAAEYKDAQSSMRYLWDLLDLSTTDNIALHIGNYLCECEEHYFQSILQDNKKIAAQSPYQATFLADQVLTECLQLLVDGPHILSNNTNSEVIKYQDTQFKLSIERNIEMLGNPNHLRLLFENLINNAQFYHKKTSNGSKLTRPIVLDLKKSNDAMHFRLYNYGQSIPEEKKDKIFQLGYSSRRKKEHHGKGLGLYFVNSIVQGYEGSIKFDNIKNNQEAYIATFYGENGEENSIGFSLTLAHKKPAIILDKVIESDTTSLTNTDKNTAEPDNKYLEKNREYKRIEQKIAFNIIKIELLSSYSRTLYTVHISDAKKESIETIENDLGISIWNIKTKKQRHATQVLITPLDISGVVFSTTLPTAQSRLDYDEYQSQENEIDINDEIDNLAILSREREFKDY
ncbi:MAG: sensor histidine kinase [Cellvibrionaceae bacterium]